MEGGFDLGEARYEIEEVNTITVLPDWTEIPLNSSELPGEVRSMINTKTFLHAGSMAPELGGGQIYGLNLYFELIFDF